MKGPEKLARARLAGYDFQSLYICPAFFNAEAEEVAGQVEAQTTEIIDTEIIELSKAAFEKCSVREHPDGVLAVAFARAAALPSLSTDTVVVVLHGLEKPGNVGAIIRTAEASGAAAVIVLGRGADPFGPNVIRASQGSVFNLPVIVLEEAEAQSWLSESSFITVACTPDAPRVYWDAPLTGRVALLLGTEHEGLPQAWRNTNHSVSIPMHKGGTADSLNVATAAALVLFECVRQRRTYQNS